MNKKQKYPQNLFTTAKSRELLNNSLHLLPSQKILSKSHRLQIQRLIIAINKCLSSIEPEDAINLYRKINYYLLQIPDKNNPDFNKVIKILINIQKYIEKYFVELYYTSITSLDKMTDQIHHHFVEIPELFLHSSYQARYCKVCHLIQIRPVEVQFGIVIPINTFEHYKWTTINHNNKLFQIIINNYIKEPIDFQHFSLKEKCLNPDHWWKSIKNGKNKHFIANIIY